MEFPKTTPGERPTTELGMLASIAAPAVYLLSQATELLLKLIPLRHSSEPAVTDEEIKLLMQQGTEAGHFHPAEKTIVDMALRLGDRRISAMMTPRTQVEWLDLSDPIEETRAKIRDSHYSRFPVAEGGRGYSCIAEQRMIETINTGKPITPFLKPGDRVEIEMLDEKRHSIFGRIDQQVAKA